jgi:hypothetical protein
MVVVSRALENYFAKGAKLFCLGFDILLLPVSLPPL